MIFCEDIICKIINFLKINNLFRLKLLNNYFNDIIKNYKLKHYAYDATKKNKIISKHEEIISKNISSLKILKTPGVSSKIYTDEFFKNNKLVELEIGNFNLTDKFYESIKNIKRLKMFGNGLSISSVKKLVNLECFRVIEYDYDKEEFKNYDDAFMNKPQIKFLKIHEILSSVSLNKMLNLVEISIYQLSHETDMITLGKLHKLKRIRFEIGDHISEDYYKYISHCASFRCSRHVKISDNNLKYFTNFTELQILSRGIISDFGLEFIKNIKILQLSCHSDDITNIGILKLKNIAVLRLFCSEKLTLRCVEKLENLEHLVVRKISNDYQLRKNGYVEVPGEDRFDTQKEYVKDIGEKKSRTIFTRI